MEEKIETANLLSEKQKNDINLLIDTCKETDHQKIDFFVEQEWNEIPECPCFFLLYEGEILICAVSVFLAGGEAEVSAVTHFEKRRKGFLTKVLKKVFEVLEPYGMKTVLFRINAENTTAKSVLEHWMAEKLQTDCLMILTTDENPYEKQRERIEKKKKIEKGEKKEQTKEPISEKINCLNNSEILKKKKTLLQFHSSAFEGTAEDFEWILENSFSEGIQIWEYQIDNKTVGMCFVSESENRYFLSAVSIHKAKQHKGYGYRFLLLLFEQLWKRSKKPVFLQVTKENTAAIKLYEKLGFSIQQQLVTYLVFAKAVGYHEFILDSRI